MKKTTYAEEKMLALLTDSPQRPGHLGSMLWPDKSRTPSAYARPAGKLLKGLERRGLARWVDDRPDGFGWVRTNAPHNYAPFAGGPPADTNYEWCTRCGVLKAMPSGDPTEFFTPGAPFDPHGSTEEPSCRVGPEGAAVRGGRTAMRRRLEERRLAVLDRQIALDSAPKPTKGRL